MKRLVIVLFSLILISSISFGQDALEKGGWMLGEAFNFSLQSGDRYENPEGDGISVLYLETDTQYLIIDKLAVGINLGYTSWKHGDLKTTNLTFGPEIEYYYPVGPGAAFVGFEYLFGSGKDSGGGTDVKETSSEIVLEVGYHYWLNESLSVFGEMDYAMQSYDTDVAGVDAVDGTDIRFNIGLQIWFRK